MNYLDDPQRELIMQKALNAYTLSEVEQAYRELRQWVRDHPQDLGIRDAFEPLSHRKDYLSETAEMEPAEAVRS